MALDRSGTGSRRFPSPLRYPGGKRKVANFIKLVMLNNGLVGREYVEPYAGGASVALSLLFEEFASHIHINDINRSVAAFWRAVLTEPDELCRRIRKAKPTTAEWRRQQAVQQAADPSEIDLAFSTFFLNRTSRSGIIGGGMIGGKDQTGHWKLDARYNTVDLTRRIERIARFRTRITFTQMDTAAYLRTHELALGERFVYLDPPYYVKGGGLYENFYEHGDHAEIAELVSRMAGPWLVSYDAVAPIEDLYKAWEHLRYGLRYSAGARYSGAEVMFFSRGLVVPGVESPANIPDTLVGHARLA